MTVTGEYKKTQREKEEFKLDASSMLVLKFGIAYIVFYTLGLVGYYLVNIPFSETLNKYVISYFSHSFNFERSLMDNATLLIYASYSDVRTLLLVFVAGFTMFSSIAIYGLLFYHALSLGFSSLYLVSSMSAGLLEGVSFFNLVFFLFSNAAIAAILLVFSSKTRIFTDKFKALGGRRKLIIRSKPLYFQIFTLLCMCGAVLFINIIRFIFNCF